MDHFHAVDVKFKIELRLWAIIVNLEICAYTEAVRVSLGGMVLKSAEKVKAFPNE